MRRFYLLQKTALDRGDLFAGQWRRLVWTNPKLDYTPSGNRVGHSLAFSASLAPN